MDGIEHLLRCLDVDTGNTDRRWQGDWPGNQGDIGAFTRQFWAMA